MIPHIDKIYLINLPKRKDRLKFQREQFEKLNIQDFTLVEPVVVTEPKGYRNKSIKSCYLTHVKIIEEIVKNQNFCIILEDDAKIWNMQGVVDNISNLFENDIEWDMFYFYPKIRDKLPNAHAYIVNPKSAQKILDIILSNKHRIETTGHHKALDHIDLAYIYLVHKQMIILNSDKVLISQDKKLGSDIDWYKVEN